MKPARLVLLLLSVAATLFAQSHSASPIKPPAGTELAIGRSQAGPAIRGRMVEAYGRLPLAFEANQGQLDPQVKFLSRGAGYNLFLTQTEAVMAIGRVSHQKADSTVAKAPSARDETSAVLRMKLVGANAETRVFGQDELPGKSNYFFGKDPQKWRTNVPTYEKVGYEGIYPGIDLVYYGNQHQLEYDFIVAPGADPGRIKFDVQGAERIRQDERGNLVLKMSEGEIRWHKPVVYQERDGKRQLVAAHYAMKATHQVGFALAKYNAARPLYIDPLVYSTYLGGTGGAQGNGITVDSAGNAYIVGNAGPGFPTMNTMQSFGGATDAFVAKINPAGSAFVYSTYLGGTGFENATGIAVDSSGNAYVTGSTNSTDFPLVNALQANLGGGEDAFVAKINPSGSALVYSTYLGGTGQDYGGGISVDSAGNAYVTGQTASTDFPTKNPLQPGLNGTGNNAFVSKINPSGSAFGYSTYLGGSGGSLGNGIAADSAGDAYVTGNAGPGFPAVNALQPVYGGQNDVFVAKINAAGSALVYSTYLGGSGLDQGFGIAADSAGNAYVTGHTKSTGFPVTPGSLQPTCADTNYHCTTFGNAFVTKIDPTGSAFGYSTYLGGKGYAFGFRIAVDSAHNAYVTGITSVGFPTVNALQPIYGGAGDAFVSEIDAAGSAFVFSTYLGGAGEDYGNGIAVDNAGNTYLSGFEQSTDFPTMNPLQPSYGGGFSNAFVTKIDFAEGTTTSLASAPNPSTYGQPLTFTAVVGSGLGAPPDGEIVSFMKGKTVLGTGLLSGGSASFTTSTLKVGKSVVKAVYGGDAHFYGSTSKTVSQVVNKATTTTTLVSSQNPSNVGQPVTFTASVAPQFSGTVKGTVTFFDGATALQTMSLKGGAAKFTTSTLTSGSHHITGTYNGNASFTGSSASLTQTVN